jgi:membrane associated rhomboid family serine protease
MPPFEGSESDKEKELEKLHAPAESTDINKKVVTHSGWKSLIWRWKGHIPYAILTVSLVEIVFYIVSNNNLQKLLRFEPNKLHEIWRFVTYMLLHDDWIHLALNVFMQILFAYFLEIRHGTVRILVLYLSGGVTAVLGASCFHPDLVIGASGGVYALLISHVADVMMNFESLNNKVYRCFCVVVIVISDTTYSVVHIFSKDEPIISWGAHVVGGISGLFLGLVFFKREEYLARVRKLSLFWLGLILYVVLLISLVVLTQQIKKCTPSNLIKTRYVYFC